MFENRFEFAGFLALLGIVAFSMTPAFWSLIVWMGK